MTYGLGPVSPPPPRKPRRLDPRPHFLPDVSAQLDGISGCPALQVPDGHLARKVRDIVAQLDVSSLEAKYSSLGRQGHAPRAVLAVWVYASLTGVHHATKVAAATKTDAAFRLLSGGREISEATLKRFRQQSLAFFQAALQQTVDIAVARGLIDPSAIAVDSVRLRSAASTKSVRTAERSKRRLSELQAQDESALDDQAKAARKRKIEDHNAAVEACAATDRTNIVTTCPSAGLLKFPDGASGAGHRVTVSATGVTERLVLALLVGYASHDYGLLKPIVEATHNALERAGVSEDVRLQIAGDAGYFSENDLVFAEANRSRFDVLIKEGSYATEDRKAPKYFGREAFTVEGETVTCPAGRAMLGPKRKGGGRLVWRGEGCESCPLRERCTSSMQRAFEMSPALEAARQAMRTRMSQPDAKTRYNQRIATIEPVFSGLEWAMGFRRLSTRHSAGVEAEITLKLLAYNLGRLIELAERPAGAVGAGAGVRVLACLHGELIPALSERVGTPFILRVYLDAA